MKRGSKVVKNVWQFFYHFAFDPPFVKLPINYFENLCFGDFKIPQYLTRLPAFKKVFLHFQIFNPSPLLTS